MAENKVCPHCGSKMFVAAITRGGIVEVHAAENEGEKDTYTILKESKDKFDVEFIKCAKCHNEIKSDDLIQSVKCAECGRMVSPQEIVNGVCPVCKAVKERAELANASKEDIIMMLLKAEQANAVNVINNKVTKAAVIEEKLTEESQQLAEAENEAEDNTTEKKTRRPRKKKSETDKVDTESEETVTKVESEEAQDDIANQQEAPWPDGLAMNPPVEPAPEQSVEQTTENFTMYEEDEAF